MTYHEPKITTQGSLPFEGPEAFLNDLRRHLDRFVARYEAYEQAACDLSPFLETTTFNPEKAVVEVVNDWIAAKCREADAAAKGIKHLSIDRDSLPYDLQNLSFRNNFREVDPVLKPLLSASIWSAPIKEVVFCALLKYDTAALYHALEKAKAEIAKVSCEDAARLLASHFKLGAEYSRMSALEVKRQKGRYILEATLYGHHHNNWDRYRNLLGPAGTFELTSGTKGFVACFESIYETLLNTSRNIESRTKLHAGNPVEAVFYNEKIKFHIEATAFEALISFLSEHCPHSMRGLEIK